MTSDYRDLHAIAAMFAELIGQAERQGAEASDPNVIMQIFMVLGQQGIIDRASTDGGVPIGWVIRDVSHAAAMN